MRKLTDSSAAIVSFKDSAYTNPAITHIERPALKNRQFGEMVITSP